MREAEGEAENRLEKEDVRKIEEEVEEEEEEGRVKEAASLSIYARG